MRKHIPLSALLLGLGGLIPFWAPVAVSLWALYGGIEDVMVVAGLVYTAYAALILSFLGGVRWGAEIVRNPDKPDGAVLAISILPSLQALIAAITHFVGQPVLAWFIIGVGLWAQFHWDQVGSETRALPPWYKSLRLILTLFANLSAAAMIVIWAFLR
jgi:hypothetical protein